MKLAFVTPWFGINIPGGAEAELRGLIKHLNTVNDVEIVILTTCVERFNSDWNKNYYKEGSYHEQGYNIIRFKVDKRNVKEFDAVNLKLMNGIKNLSAKEEHIYVDEMINSSSLYNFISNNKDNYDLFIYIPYMFGTTYFGMKQIPEKSVMIPCLHDESYAYLNVFKELFSNIKGMIFHANAECELAENIYDMKNVKYKVLGEGIDTDVVGDGEKFKDKFNIKDPFILYAGRKEAGKRVDLLLKYFEAYKKRNKSDLKLVLIGGGKIEIPKDVLDEVYDLGFVDIEDKYNAYAAADIFCQPSDHESFSIVIMESWLNKTPVIVNSNCEVTKGFARESNGGLYFENYAEFEGIVNYYINNPDKAKTMGENGRNFVLNNFEWNIIVNKYIKFFQEIIDENNNS